MRPKPHDLALYANYNWRRTLGARRRSAQTIQFMNVGTVIRQLRENRGQTLEKLANEVNSDPSNLSRVERGLQKPSHDLLVDIAAALGVRVSAIWAQAEGDTSATLADDPALLSVISRLHKLTPHHQAVVGELITGLLKLQRRGQSE